MSKPFAIPFEVPVKNATQILNGITLETSFASFLTAAATQMETQLSLLSNIGYIPSYKPKHPKPTPKMLEDEESWAALKEDVMEYILASKAKNKGRGTVKPFSIMIIDLSSGTDSNNTKVQFSCK